MAESSQRKVALFLVLILVLIGPLSIESKTGGNVKLITEQANHSSSIGIINTLNLSGNDNLNTDISFEVPEFDPVTEMQISLQPDVLEQHAGFIWDTTSEWNNPDATVGNGIRVNGNGTMSNRNNGVLSWTSPTIGWSNSAVQQTAFTSYYPLYVDAYIPNGAYLNWSITDAGGVAIPGFSGSNDALIPTNLIDYQNVNSFRLILLFTNNPSNNGPVVYSVSGDGSQKYDFSNDMMSMKPGWTVNCGPNDNYYLCGTVESMAINQVGTSYLSTNNVPLSSNIGTGLVVDYTASPAYFGHVEEISTVSPPGGLYDGPGIKTTASASGTGLSVYTTNTTYSTGVVESLQLLSPGSGFTQAQNASTDSIAGGSSVTYDFDNGLQGWSLSSIAPLGDVRRITTPSCGLSGGTGGAIQLSQDSAQAISPIVDLSGQSNILLEIWIRPGSGNCGESPDGVDGDNLRISYKNAANTWVTIDTLIGPGYSSSLRPVQQFSSTLPAGATHANSQVKIELLSGSGSSFDYWFFDDVSIYSSRASPTGLSLDYQASTITKIGVVNNSQLISGGSGYTSNGQIIQTTTNGLGSGMTVSYSANQYIDGIVDQVTLINGGSGYVSSTKLNTSGGNGVGLTVNPQLAGIPNSISKTYGGSGYSVGVKNTVCLSCTGSGLTIEVTYVYQSAQPQGQIITWALADRGTGYSTGDILRVVGGDNNATFEINSVTDSDEVASIAIVDRGSGYIVGDVLTLDGGNNDSVIEVTGTTESGGVIQTYVLQSPGTGYQINDIVKVPGGTVDAQIRVNSVSSQGGNITSFSIASGGSTYEVGDLITVPTGDFNALFNVTGIGQLGGNITNATVVFGGDGYSVNDVVTINGGDQQAQFTVVSVVDEGGNITSITPDSGEYFSVGESFVLPGGQGDAIVTISEIDKTGHRFDPGCVITSEWIYSNAPLKQISFDFDLYQTELAILINDDNTWNQIPLQSSSFYASEEIIYRYKIKFSATSTTNPFWSISEVAWTEHGGQSAINPFIDYNADGIIEWGDGVNATGQWGWQDAFEMGGTHQTVEMDSTGMHTISAWMPKNDLQGFSIGLVSAGQLNSLDIRVGSNLIASYAFTDQSSTYIVFNESQIEQLRLTVANSPSIYILNNSFVAVSFEIFATDSTLIAGYSAPNKASASLLFEEDSDLILQLNDDRSNFTVLNGNHLIPIPVGSQGKGSIAMTIDSFSSSDAVALIQTSMQQDLEVLTTSQRWLTMNSQFEIQNSDHGIVRLDVQGYRHTATWLIPTGGNNPIGQGDHELVELHPTEALELTQNGNIIDFSVTFRIKQAWDDENYIKASSRLVLSNGVISMPATHEWGEIGSDKKGLENDLEIKSVVFSNEFGTIEDTAYYLRAGDQIDIMVDVGFEDLSGIDAFIDGEALVTLYSGNTVITNTTTLDEDMWNITVDVPYTIGELDWKFEITPLNGSGVTDQSMFERTFYSDAVIPTILEMDVYRYDHRVPSSLQTFQIQITDQPLLPTNVEAMVWREWVNDYDQDGLPSPGEYVSVSSVNMPVDPTNFIGQYTLQLDDSGGLLGDKVAVYLTGSDAAGHPLDGGGSDEKGEHLFMYQLKADGAPAIPTTAFSWEGARQVWLHPLMTYEFNVVLNEPNGVSDLATVEVQLASNQNSDEAKLPISWDYLTGDCSSISPHIVIEDCQMLGPSGPAESYDESLTLNVEFHLLWSIPDLGDTQREPKLIVVDRAGNTAQQPFPTLRWRSSGDMYIPDETIQLFITQGTVVSDGARIAPGSTFEISGDVLFEKTDTRPNFDCPVTIIFESQSYPVEAKNGAWNAEITASQTSGKKALTWDVNCVSGQAEDVTDESNNRWILVDGTGPTPVEIISPRPNTILGTDVYEVRVAIDEAGGLDVDSLQLAWWVEDALTAEQLRSGFEDMSLEGSDLSGTQLEVYAEVDLSDITDSMIEQQLILFIKITGRDLADNPVLGMNGAPAGNEIAQWDLTWLRPEFTVETTSVSYTRLLIEMGQSTSVQVLVNNIGSLQGVVDTTIYVVNLNGTREVLQRPSADIPADGIGVISLDWAPTSVGIQWIEVELDNGQIAKGPTVDVRPAREQGFIDNLFGEVDPIIGSTVLLIFITIIAVGLLWARKVTRGRGSKSAHDWDEYSSEIDYEDDYEEDDYEVDNYAQSTQHNVQPAGNVAGIQPTASLGAASAALGFTAAEEQTTNDWIMGADGYWWYHDKDTDEWWYKNDQDEIVKLE